MADFFAIVVPLASPIQPVATSNMTKSTRYDRNLIETGGVQDFKMVPVELGVKRSMPRPCLARVIRNAAQAGEHRSAPMVCDATHQTICADAQFNSACYRA